MAKLLAYYSLCPINDIQEFLGLSRDVNTGCVINTLGRNIVQVVKLSNQKLLHSWTSLERLTSKVVYDFHSERYVGVFNNRYVRCWAKNQIDINKVKRVKFFRQILQLFTLDNGRVLVLYDDGTCESLQSAVDTRNEDRKTPDSITRKPNIDPARETILEICTVPLTTGDTMLAYFVRDLTTGVIELHFTQLTKENLKPRNGFRKIKLARLEKNVQLVGQCIVDGEAGPALVTIWSDKRIFSELLRLEDDPSEIVPQNIGNFISILNMINTTQPLSLIGISKDYIALYASNLNQEGATLFLYNVQFKVVQAKQFFKVYFNNSRFWLSETHILLAFGQTLSVVPFKISKEQLSDMVGSQKNLDMQNYVDNESINEDCDYEDYSFVGTLDTILDDVQEKESKTGTQRFKVFESVENIEKSLKSACKAGLQLDIIRDNTLPEDTVQMRLMSNADNSIGPLIFSEQYEAFVNEMEMHGFCEIDISDKILPIMIEANASLDIGKCLKRYNNVSERALVAVLKYALACTDQPAQGTTIPDVGTLLEKYREIEMPQSNNSEQLSNLNVIRNNDILDESCHDLLNIVLSCSFNRNSILPLLRQHIDFGALLRLLDHLVHLLTDPIAHLIETPNAGTDFDSDEKVVQWCTLLIDAHYQQIVMSRDASVKSRIVHLMEVVNRHTDSLVALKSVAATVRQLIENKGVNGEKRYNQWYNVETIQLY
ncbi:nucleolar protein 11-like isoform X2 [Sabethes cyaneus]|uniref:nucleolar protein 11-like isoform X2 n=1 Tax=Sabethes cyaneus TaxID=53552 RepID=UPI00237DADE4|nr:nucleolar protein 11-like isoform X2 [Sabethes cyaneus]